MSKATNKAKASKASAKSTSTAKNGAAKTYICKVNLAHDNDKRLPLTKENFSPLRSGGFRPMCKKCQVLKSKEWTDAKKPMRQVQARARQLTKLGIPVEVPKAKGFDIKTALPLVTIRRTVMPNGNVIFGQRVDGGKYFPSVDAEAEYDKLVAARKAKSAERKATKAPAKAKAKTATKAGNGNGKSKAKTVTAKAKAPAKKVATPKAKPAIAASATA